MVAGNMRYHLAGSIVAVCCILALNGIAAGVALLLRGAPESGPHWHVLGVAIGWLVTLALNGVIVGLAVGPRRRDMSTLQTLGATRTFMFEALLAEGAILVLLGGVVGSTFAGILVYALRESFAGAFGGALLLPSGGLFAAATAATLVFTAGIVGAVVGGALVKTGLRDSG